jgi:Tfp pilus assembly protein PilF
MVVLRPGEIPASANPTLYLESAADFERDASPEDSAKAFDAAIGRWPAEPLAWIGRGTAHYRGGEFAAAAQDYASALRTDATQAGARNNLAQSLLDLGCPWTAREQLQRIDLRTLTSPLLEAVRDTVAAADSAASRNPRHDMAVCESITHGL